jgi:hypothetical protein
MSFSEKPLPLFRDMLKRPPGRTVMLDPKNATAKVLQCRMNRDAGALDI